MQSAWRWCLGREEGPATPLLALPILLPSMERGNSARCHYCCYPTCYSERSLHHRSTMCFPPTLSMEGVSSIAATMLNQPSCRGREFYTVLPAHVIQPAILRQYASLQSASHGGREFCCILVYQHLLNREVEGETYSIYQCTTTSIICC